MCACVCVYMYVGVHTHTHTHTHVKGITLLEKQGKVLSLFILSEPTRIVLKIKTYMNK